MSKEVFRGDRFGVSVQRNHDGFAVYLPHECDTWEIAGEDNGWFIEGVAWDLAVTETRAFIEECTAALAALVSEIEEAYNG